MKREKPICSEHIGNAFILDGDWKLVGTKVVGQRKADPHQWELYNLAEDRTELNDLARQQPERVKRMSSRWQKWAEANQVFPRPQGTKKKKKM